MDITSTEAARRLGLTIGRIRQLCRAGKIRGARRVGRDWLIPEPMQVSRQPVGRPPKPKEV